jgi:flagellar hook-length control protein FliK
MTMQTTPLPFQVSGANAPGQQQRNAAAGVQAKEADFGATLSREIAQRQAAPNVNAAPAPAPANRPAAQGAQNKAADKPSAQGPKAAAREPAKQKEAAAEAPAQAQAGTAQAESADGATEAAESASAAAAAASTPVTDMLAFMASLAQPVQAATPAATAVATEAPLAAAGEQQLAALQAAFAKLDSAGTAASTDETALPASTEGDAAAGFSLGTGVQPAAGEPADLRAQQQATQGAVQADPAKLQAQAREAAVQAPAPAEAAPAPAVTQLQAQAAKLDALNPATLPSDRIPARVGTQAWDNQVSQRIVYMVGKEQAATLTLNPPDLGPVQIVLNVSNDQASVAFSASQLEVRQALENALPRLRDMMSENGIALGNATVDAGVPDGRQAQQDGERRGNGGGHGGHGLENGNAAANEGTRTVTRTVADGGRGAVDIFA